MPRKKNLIIKERGWLELTEELRKLGSEGIMAEAGYMELGPGQAIEHERSNLSNLELAFIHEFGAQFATQGQRFSHTTEEGEEITLTYLGTIPERSFIRSSFDENRNKYDTMMVDVARKVYDRKIHTEEAVARVARRMAIDIKNKIESGVPPPLEEETARRKGTSRGRTLVEKGIMRDAVVAVVQSGAGRKVIPDKIEGYIEEFGSGVE